MSGVKRNNPQHITHEFEPGCCRRPADHLVHRQPVDWDWLGIKPVGLDRYAVQVDWADENADPESFVVGEFVTPPDMAEGLSLIVLETRGPTGWPLVEAFGPWTRITSFLADYHDDPRIADLKEGVTLP